MQFRRIVMPKRTGLLVFLFSSFLVSSVGARTTGIDLASRDRGMAWSPLLDPDHADVFDHNSLFIEAPCISVYRRLADPSSWTDWLVIAKDVRLMEPSSPLRAGSRFQWRVFGTPIESAVYVAEPGRRLGYTNTPPGPPPRYAQSWRMVSQGRGCLVTTEEVGIGAEARAAQRTGDKRVHVAHDLWLASLRWAAVSAR